MPCGVETTNKIIEVLQASSHPLTILDICKQIGRTREIVRDGITNIKQIGYQLESNDVRIPGRKGRPERAYTLLNIP